MTKARELDSGEGRHYAKVYPAADTQNCNALSMCVGTPWTYHCTRAEGHEGPHVAHTLNSRAVAAWDANTP